MSNMLRRMTCLVRIDAITINWNDTTYLGKRVPFAIAGILVNTLVEENPIIACCLSVRAFSCDDVKSRTAEWNEATSPYSRTVLRHQHNSTEKMFITSATTRGQNAKELDFSKFLYSSCIWGPLGVYTSEFGNGVWFWEYSIERITKLHSGIMLFNGKMYYFIHTMTVCARIVSQTAYQK